VVYGVLGPNGAGKSTTLRMINDIIAPDAGQIRILDGLPPGNEAGKQIGYLPEERGLYPKMRVIDMVVFMGELRGLTHGEAKKRAHHWLERLGLAKWLEFKIQALSKGMQQKVQFATALIHEPALLILDEPSAGVDPILRRTIWDEIHRLRDRGVTSIVTTQYVTEAEEVDRVAVIARGRLIALDTPAGLRRRAMGGEVIEIETAETFDAATLADQPGIRNIRQTGLRSFRATVDDAGEATPEVVEAVGAAGGSIASVRELKPTFEEIFTALVEDPEAEAAAGEIQSPPREVAA
jgi:ABC-2 type transport system ATP-binding protein